MEPKIKILVNGNIKLSLLSFALSLAILAPSNTAKADIEINKSCAEDFPKWFQYFERRDCVNELEAAKAERENKEALKKRKKNREETARSCIGKDLDRMEGIVKKIKASLKNPTIFEDAQKIVEMQFGSKQPVVISKHDIRTSVIISRVETNCDSDFYLLVNIDGKPGQLIKRIATWGENAPQGYSSGMIAKLSANFDAMRRREKAEELKRFRLEKAKKSRAMNIRKIEANKVKRQAALEAERRRLKENAALKKRQQQAIAEARRRRVERIRNLPDHCAPGLSREERLRRLGMRGAVRETSKNQYSATGLSSGSILFSYSNRNAVAFCG
jgi:hypothetical protein